MEVANFGAAIDTLIDKDDATYAVTDDSHAVTDATHAVTDNAHAVTDDAHISHNLCYMHIVQVWLCQKVCTPQA